MSYFITKSTFLNTTNRIELTEEQIKKDIYKYQIFIFSKVEEKKILSIIQFFESIHRKIYEFIKRDVIEDKYEFVHEVARYPKYHADKSCEALVSNFKDYPIPVEIRLEAGSDVLNKDKIEEYRNWFKKLEIQDLLTNNPDAFLIELTSRYTLKNTPKLFEIRNMGIQSISNLSLNELEKKIDGLIAESDIYCQRSLKNAKILVGEWFTNKTYWATNPNYIEKQIKGNNTGYTDDEVREVLSDYYNKIKKPIIDALYDYWIIKYNEGLDFEENILEQLGFKPCKLCVRTDKTEPATKE